VTKVQLVFQVNVVNQAVVARTVNEVQWVLSAVPVQWANAVQSGLVDHVVNPVIQVQWVWWVHQVKTPTKTKSSKSVWLWSVMNWRSWPSQCLDPVRLECVVFQVVQVPLVLKVFKVMLVLPVDVVNLVCLVTLVQLVPLVLKGLLVNVVKRAQQVCQSVVNPAWWAIPVLEVHLVTVVMVEMANVVSQVHEEALETQVHKAQLVLQVFAILLNVIPSFPQTWKVPVKRVLRMTRLKNLLVSQLNKIPA
jgi:hypothetical protein